MGSQTWYRSLSALLLSALLLPPLGLILLWIRPGLGVFRKLLGTVFLAVLSIAHLHFFFGLRLELDGTGMRPILSFHSPRTHYANLEKHRSGQGESSEGTGSLSAAPKEATGTLRAQPAEMPESSTPATTSPASADHPSPDWPDFRGPNRDSRYDTGSIRTRWPAEGLPLLWRQPSGGGYASFVVADGLVFTIEQRRQQEVAVAYQLDTGREKWTQSWNAEFTESMGGDGPRATPTWDEGRLYVLGATGELYCFDAGSGRILWNLNILDDNGAENLTWGMSATPLVLGEKLILLPGGGSGKSVVAYDKVTGKPIWKSLSDKQAYTAPIQAELAGLKQIIIISAVRVVGLQIDDGALLWEYPWKTQYDVNAAEPLLIDENRIFVSSGYGHGAVLLKISQTSGAFKVSPVWENKRMKNKFNGSVLEKGHLYGLDQGILACLDVETGEQEWKGGRYGYGQILLASGHLIVLTEKGDLALVEATPEEHRELARFSAIPGKTWNYPAITDGRLLVRNTTEMACYDLR